MPRRDGNKKARLVKHGRVVKEQTRLSDYYSRRIENFINEMILEKPEAFQRLKRYEVRPQFLVKRSSKRGNDNRSTRPNRATGRSYQHNNGRGQGNGRDNSRR